MIDIFTYPFMLKAFAVAFMIALCAPCIGLPIVLKRFSAIGDATSHSALGGIAFGLIFGINPIIGEDAKTDLAVLKITPDKNEKLTAAVLGNSTTVEVGELAVAIGNPMGMEFSGSVTAGIVSAVNRTMSIENRTYNLIQTDAAINSGNSGGALINKYGEVIGINSVKLSTTGVEGMGFAIAISEAKPIIDDLMNSGYVTGRPYVGIGITETRYGLFISSIQKGSGAEKAGLKVDDMILEVDGQEVSSTSEINEIRDKKKPGDKLTFKILRERDTMEVAVELTEENN